MIRFGVVALALTTILGLAPIFLDTGRGSDVMQPMAIPSVGGMSVALITLFVIPCAATVLSMSGNCAGSPAGGHDPAVD